DPVAQALVRTARYPGGAYPPTRLALSREASQHARAHGVGGDHPPLATVDSELFPRPGDQRNDRRDQHQDQAAEAHGVRTVQLRPPPSPYSDGLCSGGTFTPISTNFVKEPPFFYPSVSSLQSLCFLVPHALYALHG